MQLKNNLKEQENMDVTKIDKNFKTETIDKPDIQWYSALQDVFDTRGITYAQEEGLYRRMPLEVANSINEGVAELSKHTAGGRLRFSTSSPYIAFKAVVPRVKVMSHMACSGQCGFSVYVNGVFVGSVRPDLSIFTNNTDEQVAFEGIVNFRDELEKNIEIYFPLYNGVYELYLGLKENAYLKESRPYKYDKPLVFYGSSITQGGCASRPGSDYISIASRWLDADYINLGFSGSAKGEDNMAYYLASLDAGMFILDYDANAPTEEWLKETHYPMYEKIRKQNPTTPIIFMTRPDVLYNPIKYKPRRKIIYNNYLKAKANGDVNVYFINGESLFGKEDWHSCTVDGLHPNDLGFYRMAKAVYKKVKSIL